MATASIFPEPYAGEQQCPNDYNAQKKTKHADLPPVRSGRGLATRARPASLASVEDPAPQTLARSTNPGHRQQSRAMGACGVASLALNRRPRAFFSHFDAILLCPRGGRAHQGVPGRKSGPGRGSELTPAIHLIGGLGLAAWLWIA